MRKRENTAQYSAKPESIKSRCLFHSPVGTLLLTADEEALTGLELNVPAEANDRTPVLEACLRWLEGYFAGDILPPGALPLAPQGSSFQKRVWRILMDIPRGETLTYGTIARMISPRMSAQAVGNAVGANPIPIIIPCHRVVAASGIGGYAYGTAVKRQLLELEKRNQDHAI